MPSIFAGLHGEKKKHELFIALVMESYVIADSKVVGGITDGMDRISDLLPFIIHHIMSYLNPEDIAKTSVLSKRWQYLRASFPILDFDQTDFVGTEREYDSETDDDSYDERFYKHFGDLVN